MITFAPFRVGHLQFLKPQHAQRREHAFIVQSDGAAMLEGTLSVSGWVDGRCVGAAGLIEVRPHRAIGWALLSEGVGPYMLPVVRKIRRGFEVSPYRRIEMTVAEHFDEGKRLAGLLGCELETPKPMEGYGALGGAEYMYAWVRPDTEGASRG